MKHPDQCHDPWPYVKGEHTKCMLAVSPQQPRLVPELKSISKNRKSPRTWRDTPPWAPDVSNEYDGGEKGYEEANVVCEQLS